MPFHRSRLPTRSVRHRLAAVAVATLATLASAGSGDGRAAAAGPATTLDAQADPAAALEAARARTEEARAVLDALKRAAQPGHLMDPLPEGGRSLGIEDLRGQYSALQLKAATLATTLGDHHPDLVAAQQALADLRGQLSTAVKTAAAAAERDLGDARAAESALERLITGGPADVTGSTRPRSPPSARVSSLPQTRGAVAAVEQRDGQQGATPSRDPVGPAPALTLMADADGDRLMMAVAALVLGALAAAVALFALLTPQRRRPLAHQRPVGPPIVPVAEPDVPSNVPLLATVALPAAAGASHLVSTLEREPDGTVARSASLIAEMLQRAAEAAGLQDSITVLVTPESRSVEVEALAASIAIADSAAGRRVLLLDARSDGHLRETLLAGVPVDSLLAFGPVVRPAYELQVGETTMMVLPNDPAEGEVVREAMARPGASQRQGLSEFDTVVVIGEGIEADAERLASGADLVLIAARDGTPTAALMAASRLIEARSDRPCGAVIVRPEEDCLVRPARETPSASPPGVEPAAPRTNRDTMRRRADRGGFRRTFDPSRERFRA